MKNSNLPLIIIGAVVLYLLTRSKDNQQIISAGLYGGGASDPLMPAPHNILPGEVRDPITNRNLTAEEYAAFNAAQAAGNSLLTCNPEGCAY